MTTATCHEGVTRQDEYQPCDRTAVALRIDPYEDAPYPVCVGHVRHNMVALTDVKEMVRDDD